MAHLSRVFAQVAIDSGGELILDYRVPDENPAKPAVGSLISVPLGKRVARGIVISLSEQPSTPGLAVEKIRPYHRLLFPTPVIDPELSELGDWVASYYGSSRQAVLRSFVPSGVWKGGGPLGDGDVACFSSRDGFVGKPATFATPERDCRRP